MDNASKIAALNDAFRRSGTGGRIVLTVGIQALGQGAVREVIAKVRAFNTFTEGNDPYGEHDFGAIEFSGDKIFWKIDYYDKALEYGSPDPANPAKTCRVMTIMMAEECAPQALS